jgi:hypothetical protein
VLAHVLFVGPVLAHFYFGLVPAHLKKNISDFLAFLFYQFWLISVCILCRKNTNLVLKYPVFVKTFKNTKKFEKKEKNVFVYTAKCLKAKKSYCVFSYTKKQCFNMHFGFNNQFIKVKRTLAKISKNNKNFILFIS